MHYIREVIIKILKKLGLVKQKGAPSIKEWEVQIKKAVIEPVKMLLPYLKDDSVFIDIGANVGAFTEAVIKARKNVVVHLFEPVPQYYDWLASKFLKVPNVFMNNVALSDSKGSFKLWVDPNNLGWNTMIQEKTSGNMHEITIQTIEFDEYVKHTSISQTYLDRVNWKNSSCNCKTFFKNYICHHIVGLAYRH